MAEELKIETQEKTTQERNITFMIFLSIFLGSSILLFKTPFEGYFHYLIYILLLPFFFSKFGLPKASFQLLLLPLVVGIFQVMIGNNDTFLFIKIFGGVLLSVSFYYYVMQYFELDVDKMFRLYLTWAYWTAVIALIQVISYKLNFTAGYDYSFLLNKGGHVVTEGGGIRVSSIFLEPSQLGIMLGPAAFVSILNIIRKKKYHFKIHQNIIILLALYLSKSSTGYLGIFFTILIIGLNFGYIAYVVMFVFLGYFAALGLYNTVDEFKDRVDSSTALWLHDDLAYKNVNTSSFVLYNNAHVAWSNFKEHPLFGTGLGSHPYAYDKYSYTKKEVKEIKGIESNMKDANSTFFRIMSEAGLIGILFLLALTFKCFVGFSGDEDDVYWIISGSVLVLMLLYYLRQGNYFLNGFPFFIWLYYYTKQASSRRMLEKEDAKNELANT